MIRKDLFRVLQLIDNASFCAEYKNIYFVKENIFVGSQWFEISFNRIVTRKNQLTNKYLFGVQNRNWQNEVVVVVIYICATVLVCLCEKEKIWRRFWIRRWGNLLWIFKTKLKLNNSAVVLGIVDLEFFTYTEIVFSVNKKKKNWNINIRLFFLSFSFIYYLRQDLCCILKIFFFA